MKVGGTARNNARQTRRWLIAAIAATVAVGFVAALAGGAFADNTTPDGDNTTPVAANPLAFGTVCVNSTTNAGALVAISRNGSGTNTFANSATVTVSVQSVSGTGLSAAIGNPATITLPSNWTSLSNNTMSDAVSSQVTLLAGSSAGSFSGSITYAASGQNTSGSTITRTATMVVSATVSNTGACSPVPPDSTPPTVTVSFPSPVSGQNGWFNAADVTPVVGTVTASDDSHVTNISCTGATLSGTTGYGTSTASGTLTVSGDGIHNVNCTATDGATPANSGAAGGSSNTATIKIDTTAPAITDAGFGSGTAGDNGWYVSAVTEDFNASDPTSGLADCAASFTKSSGTSEGSAVTISSGSCSDTAGNTNTGISSGSYKIDETAPTLTDLGPTSSPNGNGWYNADVTNRFEASDSLSGLDATCQAAFPSGNPTHYIQSQTTSGQGTAVSVTSDGCTDLAGNHVAGITSADFQIDETAPTVLVTGVSDGATYTLGSVPSAGCSTSDTLSGVQTQATLSTSGGPVGSITATCSGATDNAGNTNSASATYRVVYNFSGFFQPVDNPPTCNTVKAGQAIPVKFSLHGYQGLNIFASGSPSVVAGTCAGVPLDAVETTLSAGNSSLSYDLISDQYTYVWKTDKAWAGKAMRLSVEFADGTTQYARFSFTK